MIAIFSLQQNSCYSVNELYSDRSNQLFALLVNSFTVFIIYNDWQYNVLVVRILVNPRYFFYIIDFIYYIL